ncbi:MAG: histidinol-phosphate transaminase [Methanomicrobiales archaeon]|nr:histidinol-phosphate transaminase [Methanomicrobiales archaeon]
MERLVRDIFRSGGYVFATGAREIAARAGHRRPALLASNENPFPPSPRAISAAGEALATVNRYPDETGRELIAALERCHGRYRFVTGVGMDGVIETVIRTLVSPGDRVAVLEPTFSFYGLAARAQGAVVERIARESDFSVDPGRVVRAAGDAKLTFLCSPNNPTGNATPPAIVREIAEGLDGMLFLDNAYVEFSGIDYRPLLECPNIILGRTFSKAYALAGLRIGYAFVPGWFEPYYRRAETPFTLNAVSSAAAAAALADDEHRERTVSHIRSWRERMMDACPFPVFPSDANFFLVDVAPMTGEEAVAALAQQGVIVRSCTSFPGLGNHFIRVSIGDAWENELFLAEVTRL